MQDSTNKQNNTGRIYVVGNQITTWEETITVAKALASEPRMRILEFLITRVASLSEISNNLDMPIATASLHLKALEEAGLLSSHNIPGKRGQQRIYTRIYDAVVFNLPGDNTRKARYNFMVQMPVGGFVNHSVVPTCGLAGTNAPIGIMDDPVSFYEPERYHAQLVWLSHGYLEYHFPNHIYGRETPNTLQISMEICSEAAPSADDWPSDIFLEINGVRIGIWTSPSDFGGKRGIHTPLWWADWNSQYGWLKVWRVDEDGSYIDGRALSTVTIHDLMLSDKPYITVRIGVDDHAENKGGLNLFGKNFGNHAQDIIMQLDY